MSDERITLELLGSRTLALGAELRDLQLRFGALESRFGALESRFAALETTVFLALRRQESAASAASPPALSKRDLATSDPVP